MKFAQVFVVVSIKSLEDPNINTFSDRITFGNIKTSNSLFS